MTAPCDCGHPATPAGAWPGYATDPATGKTLCGGCADQAETARFATARTFTGYVSGNTFTTWTGHPLAYITSQHRGRLSFTPTGGAYRMRYVTARDFDDGHVWRGHGSDDHDLVTLRRVAS